MAKLNNYEFKIELVESGEIIAYRLDDFLSLKQFENLPKSIQKLFIPIHEKYKVRYK